MKIAIIYPVPFLDSVPIVQSLALKLANTKNKIELFVYSPGPNHNFVSINNKNIKIHYFKKKNFSKDFFFSFLPSNIQFFLWSKKIIDKKNFDHIIGVDPVGLTISGILFFLNSINFSYLSLELILATDKKYMYKNYKFLESFFIKKTKNIIIQDSLRRRLLENEYGIKKSKFLLFPNSPIGNAKIVKSKWLHKKLNIPLKSKIILYSGSWSHEFLNNWITELASKEIKDLVIVVQTRSKFRLNKNTSCKNIKFLTTPVKYFDLNKLISSACVAFAFYDTDYTKNIKYVGKSSGKICHYLFNGIPVICNKLPYWSKSLKKFKSGLSVNSSIQLEKSIKKIIKDHKNYSKGAITHFNKDLKIKFLNFKG